MIEEPYSIYPKCGEKGVKSQWGESYCAPCRSAYHRVIVALKKKHSPPEDHICDICGKSEDQLKTGVTPGYIRLAVGLEHIDDILEDLSQALDNIGLHTTEVA